MSKITYDTVAQAVAEMSADGRYLFNRQFLTDALTGATQAITTSSGNDASLSPDGRFAAFQVNTDTGTALHVWDRTTATDRRFVSIPSSGTFSDGVGLVEAGNGFVLFETYGSVVGPTSINAVFTLTRYDLSTGATQVVYDGHADLGVSCEDLKVSADGRYALVQTFQSQVGAAAFRLDLQTGAKVPIDQAAIIGGLSGDGRHAVFTTGAGLAAGDTNGLSDVYLKDFATGEVRLVSRSSTGAASDGTSYNAVISDDGSRVAFVTEAGNLLGGALTGRYNVMVKDLATGILAVVGSGGEADSGLGLAISADGLTIAFNQKAGQSAPIEHYVAHFLRPSITIDKVSGDNAVNAAEAGAPVVVEGLSDAVGGLLRVVAPNGDVAFATVGADNTWRAAFDDLSDIGEGARAFTASVLDDAGVRGDANRSVVFDTTKPTLVVLPVAGDNLVNAAEAANVTLAGTSDAIGRLVAITLNGEFVGSATVGSNGAWNLPLDFTGRSGGFYAYSASVTDAAGNVFTRSVSFDVDTKPPVVNILAIAGDNVVGVGEADSPVAIRGTSDAIGRTVSLTFDNQVRGTAVVQADGTWKANVSFKGASGDAVVFAEVKDAAGNAGSDTETVLVDSNVIRVSTRADGTQGLGSKDGFFGGADLPSASADGRTVVFTGYLLGLADGESTSHSAIYLKDVLTGDIRVVSSRPGVAPDGQAYAPSISADGRFVAFVSGSSTLVGKDTNRLTGPGLDVFVFDRKTGAYQRANTSDAGAQANDTGAGPGVFFEKPALSADGRYVAFTSRATNLEPGVSDGSADFVYIKDRQTGDVRLASANTNGTAMRDSCSPSLSADGRVIAFEQVTYDANNVATRNVYAKNLDSGALTLVSSSASGLPAVFGAGENRTSGGPVISPDGKLVAFYSNADSFASKTPSGFQIFVKTIATGAITLVSPPNGSSDFGLIPSTGNFNFSFSQDGRHLAFSTYAAGVAQDVDGKNDVYVRDLQTGALRLVTPGNVAESYDRSEFPELTADGRYIVYDASTGQLVQDDTNGVADVFLQRLQSGSLALAPIAGDDRVEAAEAGGALPVSGKSSAIGGTVTIKIDRTTVSTATVQADGTWTTTFSSLPLKAGTHSVTASVRDALGFTSSDGAILTVDRRTSPATRDDDILLGTSGNDKINGFAGDDTLVGGAKGDTLIGGSGSDTASYASAKKAVTASLAKPSGNTGDAKGDTYSSIENLLGSGFADKLTGNEGKNTLSGAGGKDTLSGGRGADTFLFDTKLSTADSRDTITDFSLVQGDRIALDNDLFVGKLKADRGGHLLAAQFQDLSQGKADKADRILYDTLKGDLYFDKDGSGKEGAVPLLFAHLDLVKGKFALLDAGDFLVV